MVELTATATISDLLLFHHNLYKYHFSVHVVVVQLSLYVVCTCIVLYVVTLCTLAWKNGFAECQSLNK